MNLVLVNKARFASLHATVDVGAPASAALVGVR